MRVIAKYIGGSQLYGLDTPESDTDWRGCFLSEDVGQIIGLRKDKVVHDTREFGDDVCMYELRRLMKLLEKTNTQSVEGLFVPEDHFEILQDPYPEILKNKWSLLNSRTLLHSTRGYVQSESRLALGERTGRLGSKRKASLDKFGFSPKNVTQIIRIVVAAEHFLKYGHYPLRIDTVDQAAFDLAFKIKTKPHLFSAGDVRSIVGDYDQRAQEAKDLIHLSFNEDVANEIFLKAYQGILYGG